MKYSTVFVLYVFFAVLQGNYRLSAWLRQETSGSHSQSCQGAKCQKRQSRHQQTCADLRWGPMWRKDGRPWYSCHWCCYWRLAHCVSAEGEKLFLMRLSWFIMEDCRRRDDEPQRTGQSNPNFLSLYNRRPGFKPHKFNGDSSATFWINLVINLFILIIFLVYIFIVVILLFIDLFAKLFIVSIFCFIYFYY